MIPPELLSKLEDIFHKFDIDGGGTVEMSEVLEKFKHSPTDGEKVAQLFLAMDNDGNDEIDMDEFLTFWKGQLSIGKTAD